MQKAPWRAAFDVISKDPKSRIESVKCRGCAKFYKAGTNANISIHIFFPSPRAGGCTALDANNPKHMAWIKQTFGKPEDFDIKKPLTAANSATKQSHSAILFDEYAHVLGLGPSSPVLSQSATPTTPTPTGNKKPSRMPAGTNDTRSQTNWQ